MGHPAEVTEAPAASAANCAEAASPAGAAAPDSSSNADGSESSGSNAIIIYSAATPVGSSTAFAAKTYAETPLSGSVAAPPVAAPLASGAAMPAAAQMAAVKAMLADAPLAPNAAATGLTVSTAAAPAQESMPVLTSDAATPEPASASSAAVSAPTVETPAGVQHSQAAAPAPAERPALQVGQPACIIDCGGGQKMAVHVTAVPPGVFMGSVPTIMAQPADGSPVTFQLTVSAVASASGSASSSNIAQPQSVAAMQQYEIQAGSDCEEPPILLENESGEGTKVTGARALDGFVEDSHGYYLHKQACSLRICLALYSSPWWQSAWQAYVCM